MQAKRRMKAPSSYRAVDLSRNERLEHVLPEAAGDQVAQCPSATAAPPDHALGAHFLGLQCRERVLDDLGVDLTSRKVGADQRVAAPALGEEGRARLRQPPVVDVAAVDEPFDHLTALVPLDALIGQAGFQLGCGSVASA